MLVIKICANISVIQQEPIVEDYIPEMPLQTILSQECGTSQSVPKEDEDKGAFTVAERLLSILTTAPNDDIADEEYLDALMGNDIEDDEYEQEETNDYEQEDPNDYEHPYLTSGRDSEEGTALHHVIQEGMAGQVKVRSPGVQKLGSFITQAEGVVQFKRLFWAFKPCNDAWWQLKPMFQVDSTFLYGKYKHLLLITMVCLIHDRGTGLLAALDHLRIGWQPTQGHNVFCIHHVASNQNSKFRNKAIKGLLMKAGHEYTSHGCKKRLAAIRALNKYAADWIDKIPREKWTRAYEKGRRYANITTNLAKCMKGVLKGARYLPITSLV
ncbi:uncharacterized protein G2W53_013987 [Senna tora]|uniref:MULE transposase domain-containing protein n=1 Tax=Senna tora TaxID=362788 RepID=A0A834U0L2_9FABA|nr:uncharacterized protein G2W53_013987 [Senna tora]